MSLYLDNSCTSLSSSSISSVERHSNETCPHRDICKLSRGSWILLQGSPTLETGTKNHFAQMFVEIHKRERPKTLQLVKNILICQLKGENQYSFTIYKIQEKPQVVFLSLLILFPLSYTSHFGSTGICAMCGKKVLDTKNYKQTSV